jgi:hypothetical protein
VRAHRVHQLVLGSPPIGPPVREQHRGAAHPEQAVGHQLGGDFNLPMAHNQAYEQQKKRGRREKERDCYLLNFIISNFCCMR